MRNNAEEIPEVINNIRRVYQAITEYMKNAEKITGLTGPQLLAVKLLANTAHLRVSELARQMILHPATVVGILDRLETKGMVTRTRSIEDRRVVEIELTDLGKEVVAKAPEIATVMLVEGLERLPDTEFYQIAESMKRVVLILGAEKITPQPLQSA